MGDDLNRFAWGEAAVAEPDQTLRIGIGEADDLVPSRFHLGEPGDPYWAPDLSFCGGDRVTVRVGAGMIQLGVDAFDHGLGGGVFEAV